MATQSGANSASADPADRTASRTAAAVSVAQDRPVVAPPRAHSNEDDGGPTMGPRYPNSVQSVSGQAPARAALPTGYHCVIDHATISENIGRQSPKTREDATPTRLNCLNGGDDRRSMSLWSPGCQR